MLSTWKQPIPGSMEHRPVFPLEVVKPIDTTLLKVRTIALQHQQAARSQTPSMHALPPRPGAMTPQPDWARIGTPPQSHPMYPQAQQHVDPRYRVPSALPQQQSPYAIPPSPYLQMQQPNTQQVSFMSNGVIAILTRHSHKHQCMVLMHLLRNLHQCNLLHQTLSILQPYFVGQVFHRHRNSSIKTLWHPHHLHLFKLNLLCSHLQ
jgi:hypothetical protein